jgi:predicted Zn-dependent protease
LASAAVGLGGGVGVGVYSRSQEAEADAKAIDLLQRAGLPPWSLRYALEFLRDVHGETGGGWFASHPVTSERISSQPAIGTEVATQCPSAEIRAAQIAATQAALAKWKADEPARMKRLSEETRKEHEATICRGNRTC